MENFFKLSPQEYIKKTIDADMSDEYSFFEPYLKKGASILDVGFGSARDMLYFKSQGYQVSGVEIEEEYVKAALKLGLDVKLCNVLKYHPKEKFDAIWVCASLVHASKQELPELFNKLLSLIKDDGVIYCSFKYGTWEGYIAERYFTYLNEETIKEFNLNIIDMHIAKDSLNRGNSWISFIIKKN